MRLRPYYALAYGTAGLFLLHPVQTQTVSYVIQGQLEGLATLSILIMLLCYDTYARSHSWVWSTAAYGAAIISCGTKEIAIVGPLLLALYDWFFIAQGAWPSFKKRILMLGGLTMVVATLYLMLMKPIFFIRLFGFSLTTYNNWGNCITDRADGVITAFDYLRSEFKVILHYIWIFFWPFGLSVDYDWKLCTSWWSPDCVLPLALLSLGGVLIARRLRRMPADPFMFGILWFFIATLPRASILPSSELVADYKTYLSSFGILFFNALAIHTMLNATHSTPRIFFTYTFLLLACAGGTYLRNTIWRSGTEFWYSIVTRAPRKARAWNNYGVALSEAGKQREALAQFQYAIFLDKRYADPYGNMAVAHGVLKEYDKAITAQKECIRLNPTQPEAYNNLASFLLSIQQPEQALKVLEVAIHLRPHYGKAYFNMGRAHYELKDKEKAYEKFKKACMEADLDNYIGFDAYARACIALGKFKEAKEACMHLQRLNPHTPDTFKLLGNIHLIEKEYAHAQAYFQKALAQDPHDARIQFSLGEALLGAQKYDSALTTYKAVIAQDRGHALAYLRVARCLDALGRRPEAITCLEQFILMGPPKNFLTAAHTAVESLRRGEQHTRVTF